MNGLNSDMGVQTYSDMCLVMLSVSRNCRFNISKGINFQRCLSFNVDVHKVEIAALKILNLLQFKDNQD